MKTNNRAHVFLLLALTLGLTSSALWAVEDGLGTNVVRNLRVAPDGTLSLGGMAITNWTLLPVNTGSVSLVDFEAWSNAVQNATNALNTNKLGLSGGVMTGPLTNEAGFFGDGAGVTNLNATNLTGMVNAARLGSNTADAGVFLRGDRAWTNRLNGNATTNAFVVNTNQLVVNNGKVGIGRETPTALLDIKTDAGFTRAVRIGPQTDTLADGAYIQFGSSGAASGDALGAQIGGRNEGESGSNALVFLTGDSIAERMRINNAGYVGIGTNIPSEKLEVVGNIKASGTNTASSVVMAQGSTYNVTDAGALIPFSASYITITGTVAVSASVGTNNAVAGQILILQGGNGNPVTLTNGGNVALSSGVDFTFAANNTMQLIWNGTRWVELNRVAQ